MLGFCFPTALDKLPVGVDGARSLGGSHSCQTFAYEEVMKVTDKFSRKIGEGGYGPVFHGRLENGQSVAVKILSTQSKQGSKEFETEVGELLDIFIFLD